MVTIWTITASGFTSVVRYKPAKDMVNKDHKALAMDSDNPQDWLIIRARVKADLEQVEKVSGLDLHIATDPSADYAYRGLCRTAEWQEYMAKEIANVDYDSHFKEVVQSRAPQVAGRYQGMMSMWTAMAKWQDYSPYSGHKRTATDKNGFKSTYSGKGYTGFNVPKSAASSATLFTPPTSKKYREPEDLTPYFAPSENTVSLKNIADLIRDHDGAPMKVPSDSINNSTDEGFEMWVRACDKVDALGRSLTQEEIETLQAEVEADRDSLD